ncbi:hypothetical protein BDQ94DRAFT_75789 [Aspergillus welwitschiae]|uniref:Uncharacterized protein n=1 Tax=Aspergillus welwitschiae TaxID=1341132 RepID=A0A3F3PU43_9EURO|nr:hypothetical protein BDQ94DRAFT_75789 [Aspergillus welwitschiae]RDH30385.1 hypothetical protein BDQ94DRAFT_75789 [Aspergillus welwitschiae]
MTRQVIRIPDDSDPDRPNGLKFTSPLKTPLTLPHLYPKSPSEDENSMILSIIRKADFFPTNNRELKLQLQLQAPSIISYAGKRERIRSARTPTRQKEQHTQASFSFFLMIGIIHFRELGNTIFPQTHTLNSSTHIFESWQGNEDDINSSNNSSW